MDTNGKSECFHSVYQPELRLYWMLMMFGDPIVVGLVIVCTNDTCWTPATMTSDRALVLGMRGLFAVGGCDSRKVCTASSVSGSGSFFGEFSLMNSV